MKKIFIFSLLIIMISISYSYNLQPGDKLKIIISGLTQFNDMIYMIQSDGTVNLPFLGDVKIAGLTTKEVEKKLVKEYSNILKLPEVMVLVLEKAPIYVNVIIGKNAKMVSVPEGSNIMMAVAASHLELTGISLSKAIILKKNGEIKKVNIKQAIKNKTLDKIIVQNGDTVILKRKVFYISLDTLLKIVSLVSSTIVILKYFNAT